MSQIVSYKDLIVWQKAIDLVDIIFEITEKFPKSETFGLTSQMNKSAVSIASNIAEGSRRGTRKDFRKFLVISFGSGAELETQIIIAKRRPYGKMLNYQSADVLLNEVMRMLNKMISNMRS